MTLRSIIPLLLLVTVAPLASEPTPPRGQWFDRFHSGHGLDLHRAGSTLFGAFYTYDADGEPEWLWIQNELSSAPESSLTRFRLTANGLQGMEVGEIALTPVASCPDGRARPGATALLRMDWRLDGLARSWCVEPLLPADRAPESVLSGAWHEPSEPGWGLMVHAWRDAAGQSQSFRTLYFHDAGGHPRWAFAQDPLDGLEQTQTFYSPQVSCRDCSPASPQARPVGGARIALRQPRYDADGARNDIDVSVSFASGPVFARQVALAQLSEPMPVPGAGATTEGPIAGEVLASGVTVFRGLPFVQAPVGDLRWRSPLPLSPRDQTLNATVFGPGCPQPPGSGFFQVGLERQDEDCLQLNLWQPSGAGPHPVMVWIHGGGLTQGSAVQRSGSRLVYDGEGFAKQGVVLVSINYRLGPLGFMALREVAGTDPGSPQGGNYGLLDQAAALRWLQENLAAFGGDPAQVTIFGESAGGVSVCALLAAPAAQGLFSRAMIQSGNCRNQLPTLAQSYLQGDQVIADAKCTDAADRLACLRELSSAELLTAADPVINTGVGGQGRVFGLILDGSVLPLTPAAALASGQAAQVPLVIGVNADEQSNLSPASLLPATVAGYEAEVRARFTQIGDLVLARYPASDYATPQRALQTLLTDIRFVCANRRAAADHAAQGSPVWHYVLTEVLPDLAELGAFHGLDIGLLFGPRPQALAAERELSESMQRAWIDFAGGLAPGESDGNPWPQYRAEDRLSRELSSATPGLLEDWRGDFCRFWATFVAL